MSDVVKKDTPEWESIEEDTPEWESIEEMIEYINHGISAAMVTLTRIMWEAGKAGESLKDEAKYGEGAIASFAEGIHRGTSWVYECIKMSQSYTWREIQEKFLKAGIPASSIARLSAISDDGARNYVEDKLVNGDITYEDIGKAKKEYTDVENNPEVSHSEIGDGAVQTLAERSASDNLGDDDPNNVAAGSIRAYSGARTREAQTLKHELGDKVYEKIDQLDMITDKTLYDLSADRLSELALSLRELAARANDVAESIEKKTGPTEEKSPKKTKKS